MNTKPEDVRRMRARVARWAARLLVEPRAVRVQHMTKKWGSCSSTGTVTFAAELASRDALFQDMVIVHELLHLRVPNHGKLFRALMTAHVPQWRGRLPEEADKVLPCDEKKETTGKKLPSRRQP